MFGDRPRNNHLLKRLVMWLMYPIIHIISSSGTPTRILDPKLFSHKSLLLCSFFPQYFFLLLFRLGKICWSGLQFEDHILSYLPVLLNPSRKISALLLYFIFIISIWFSFVLRTSLLMFSTFHLFQRYVQLIVNAFVVQLL